MRRGCVLGKVVTALAIRVLHLAETHVGPHCLPAPGLESL